MKTADKETSKKVSAEKGAAKDLKELFIDSLQDIYWAEKALTKALPKMSVNVESDELGDTLDEHLSETEEQMVRLEEIFESIGEEPKAKKCDAMEGILKEGESILKETEIGDVRDAGIIAACQKVEHYEIATYGTLVSWAKTLKLTEAVKLLKETLEEEKAADRKLSELATNKVNQSAKA